MEAAELDNLLDELETKVERLRSLYEQYFLGIEKTPPQVVQKDVDRKLYALRRVQIRNTARRFKLQTIIQRYNTFQQYWMRIMREIEKGTYRRHVLRAERTVGVTDLLTAAERKRIGLPDRNAKPALTEAAQDVEEFAAKLAEPTEDDLPTEAIGLASAGTPPSAQVPAPIERARDAPLDDELDRLDTTGLSELGNELDDPLLASTPPPPHKRVQSARPLGRRSMRPIGSSSNRSPASLSKSKSPSTDTGSSVSATTQSGSDSGTTPSPDPTPTRAPRRSLRPSRIGSGLPIKAGPSGLRLPASSAVAGRGLPPMPGAGVPRGAPPTIPSRSAGSFLAPTVEPARQAERPAPHGPRNASGGSIPGAAKPAAQPDPTRHSPIRPTATEAKHPEGLDRTRIEQVAEKLRNARKQTSDTSPVSVDALAKKLQRTTEELQKKHHGRRVDFDVIIKDGKAIIRPIVR